MDRHLIDPELPRRLRKNRLHERVGLESARRPLRAARRRVGEHGDHPPPHRERLVRERDVIAGRSRIVDHVVRSVVDDHETVERGDAPILAEADLDAREGWSCPPDVVLIVARHAHHHGRIRLFREKRGHTGEHRRGPFTAEPATGVLADDDYVLAIDADPARDGSNRGMVLCVEQCMYSLPFCQ